MLLTGAEDKEVRLHDITSMETTRVSYTFRFFTGMIKNTTFFVSTRWR